MSEPSVKDVNSLFATLMTDPTPQTLNSLAETFKAMLSQGESGNIDGGQGQDADNKFKGGRRSSKKRGTQRKQKRRQRRGSRRAY